MNAPTTDTRPPCADWALWTGPEVEGRTDLGIETLFVRSVDCLQGVIDKYKPARVWLCKEYLAHIKANPGMEDALKLTLTELEKKGTHVCLELTYYSSFYWKSYRKFSNVHFYVKMPSLDFLRADDYVCVGKAFHDELFAIGTVPRLSPALYMKDVQLSED